LRENETFKEKPLIYLGNSHYKIIYKINKDEICTHSNFIVFKTHLYIVSDKKI